MGWVNGLGQCNMEDSGILGGSLLAGRQAGRQASKPSLESALFCKKCLGLVLIQKNLLLFAGRIGWRSQKIQPCLLLSSLLSSLSSLFSSLLSPLPIISPFPFPLITRPKPGPQQPQNFAHHMDLSSCISSLPPKPLQSTARDKVRTIPSSSVT